MNGKNVSEINIDIRNDILMLESTAGDVEVIPGTLEQSAEEVEVSVLVEAGDYDPEEKDEETLPLS